MGQRELQRLEKRLDEQARLIESLRNSRIRRRGQDIPIRLARTAEEEPSGYDHGYVATSRHDLPIIFVDATINGSGELQLTDRSEHAKTRAISPFGWLPPGLTVEVTENNGLFRIVRCPMFLRGLITIAAADAELVDSYTEDETTCDDWTDGSATMRVWRWIGGFQWQPQSYSNDDPVLLAVTNPTDGDLEVDRPVFANLDAADRKWIAMPAWCGTPGCTAE